MARSRRQQLSGMDYDLIDAEIEVLRMLAGQVPFIGGVAVAICLEELARRGFCTANATPRITPSGLEALEFVTDTIDLRSRVASRRR